eukprot:11021285-Alexandrium_andersonii.AAC.1
MFGRSSASCSSDMPGGMGSPNMSSARGFFCRWPSAVATTFSESPSRGCFCALAGPFSACRFFCRCWTSAVV